MVAKFASVVGFGVLLSVCSCGGSEPRPTIPSSDDSDEEEAADESWETGRAPSPDATEEEADEPKEESEEVRKEPEFTPGMSVNEAIAAVPSHYEYVGIEQEVLAKPLTNIETYKDCKISQSTHFTVKIAVWNGRVVGADVETKGNKALAACIDEVVRKLEYKEQVEAINTVEFSF
jgi:hypothetical protein